MIVDYLGVQSRNTEIHDPIKYTGGSAATLIGEQV